jgi:hypothetical protein
MPVLVLAGGFAMKDFGRHVDGTTPLNDMRGLDEDFVKAIERLERQALVQVTPTPPRHAYGRRNWDPAVISLHHELSRRESRLATWALLRPAALIGAVAAGIAIGMTLVATNMTGRAPWGPAAADLPAKFRDTFNAVAEEEVKTATSDTLLPSEQGPANSLAVVQPVGEAGSDQKPSPVPPASSSVAQTQLATVEPPRPITPQSAASGQLDQAEITSLLERGRKLAAMGDIASARLIFGRLMRTGNLGAIVSLADTFEPANLARLRVTGSLANPTKARELYQMAAQAGSKEAQARLENPAVQPKQ